MEKVIIIGAGGHARVVADIALLRGDRVLGFLDDSPNAEGAYGIPVLGAVSDFSAYPDASFIIGIGSAQVRQRLARQLAGVRWYTAIHPSAVISPLGVTVGEGTVVAANACINPGAQIGEHCIINTAAVVEHDNRIGSFAHISVGAKLGGNATVGERAWIGIGATVSNGVSICADCMLGAGAVAVREIRQRGTYVGIPARRLP